MTNFSILYPKKTWGIKGISKNLSDNQYLNLRISTELAQLIQCEVPSIHKPSYAYNLKLALLQLEQIHKSRHDTLTARVQNLIHIFHRLGEQHTCRDLESIIAITNLYYQKRA